MATKPSFRMTTFEVRGTIDFPIDMLRYDCAAPATGEDVSKIMADVYGGHGVRVARIVTLRRFYPVGGNPNPEAARWASFGWEVISIDGRRVKP